MAETNLTASQIRSYKENIKKTLKTKLAFQSMKANMEKEPTETATTRRRRKTSQCLKEFDTMTVFKDVSMRGKFEDVFKCGDKIGEGAHSTVHRC